MKPPCSCTICHKEFSNYGGFVSHYENKHENKQEKYRKSPNSVTCLCCAMSLKDNAAFDAHWNKCTVTLVTCCKECGKWFPGTSDFCSHSCSAKNSNRSRAENGWVMSESSKQQIGNKLRLPKFEDFIDGPYTKIRLQQCLHCDKEFYTDNRNMLCFSCKIKNQRSTDIFRFKFNVFDFPELFDLEIITTLGWYSQGGKSRAPYNPKGVSRDHKVSTSEAKKNNYDPYYITHPMNCEIMTQSENSSKNRKSSITYQELVELVNLFDGEKCRTRTD